MIQTSKTEGEKKKEIASEATSKDQTSAMEGDNINEEKDDEEKLECKSNSSVISPPAIKLSSFSKLFS